MNRKDDSHGISRRKFLKTGVGLTAGSFLVGTGAPKLFGAAHSNFSETIPETVTLNNGVQMPVLGFGTLSLKNEPGIKHVADAISLGYRLLDTATIYGNEESVGAGIKESGINREELFVTSKVWSKDWAADEGYNFTKKEFQISLDKLELDYLDLYLIHRPWGDVKGTWKAMEDLYKEGKIRVIGVSNFDENQLEELLSYATVKPAVNQIESHVFYHQDKANKYLKKLDIKMEAWAPLAKGRKGHFTNETLAEIGKKYNKSIAQVSLRWHYQRGIIAIPRSSQTEHRKENLNIFDFKLDKDDMKMIDSLDTNTTII